MEVDVYLPNPIGTEENFFLKYMNEIISFFIGFGVALILVVVIKLAKRKK
ncbi:MAG: hypothetical protein ACFFKA_08790 [Candidatus Thorarchaeota archaeon]